MPLLCEHLEHPFRCRRRDGTAFASRAMSNTLFAHASYVPSSVVQHLKEMFESNDVGLTAPFRQTYHTAVLFADVSGFTKLSEYFAARDPNRGHEQLHVKLNAYFQSIIRVIGSQGGDIFKFAGDAMIVLWPKTQEPLERVVLRAGQCAMQIKTQCQEFKIDHGSDLQLNVKVGIGVGKISILHVGGLFNRLEYVPTGDALSQSFRAEHHADAKKKNEQVIMSPEAFALVKSKFRATFNKGDGYAYLQESKQNVTKTSLQHIMRMVLSGVDQDTMQQMINKYEPAAVRHYVEHSEEKWAAETRDLTVLFVNLGLTEEDMKEMSSDKDLQMVHEIIFTVQTAVYFYEGSINKFLMDDKGSTLIAVFGLPPLAHEDDPLRGLFCAMQICTELRKRRGLYPSVGVTTGAAFCGIIGNRNRREYSILGDCVNLSARLMQHAKGLGGGVVCDGATWHVARHDLAFHSLDKIAVKGKSKPVKIFHPYDQKFINSFRRPTGSAARRGRKAKSAPSRRSPAKSDPAFDILDAFARRSASHSVNPRQWLNSGMRISRSKLKTNTHTVGNYSKRQFESPAFHHALDTAGRQIESAKARRKGSVLVVKAEVGLGKTRLCARVHELHSATNSCFYTKAHEFNVGVPLFSFRPIVTRMLDPKGKGDPRVVSKELLRVLRGAGMPLDLAAALNDVLTFRFEVSSRVSEMTRDERMGICVRVFCEVILAHSRKSKATKATVLMVDDAIFLDEQSWALLLLLADAAVKLPFFLLVTTRPIIRTYCATYTKNPTEWCRRLCETSDVCCLTPLPDEVIYRIICQSMRVNDCPPELSHFILQEARGNPTAIQDLVYILEEEEKLFTIDSGRVVLRSGIDWDALNRTVQCPRGMRLLMARQLDRVSSKAQMMLKIAALIGERFQFWLIREVFPLRDTRNLWQEFRSLEKEGILVRPASAHLATARTSTTRASAGRENGSSSAPGRGGDEKSDAAAGQVTPTIQMATRAGASNEPEAKDRENDEAWQRCDYVFANRLMRNLLRRRTVMSQIQLHKARINATRLQHILEVAKRARAAGEIKAQLRVLLRIGDEEMKEHLALVCGNGLYLYRSDEAWRAENPSSDFVYVDLASCTARLHPDSIEMLRIQAYVWMRDGQSQEEHAGLCLRGLSEGRPFPRTFIAVIRSINRSFEQAVARKQQSIASLSRQYQSMIDSKLALKQEYTDSDKVRLEGKFRSNSIFAIRRLETECQKTSNCLVHKSKRRVGGAWKKRTAILTKVGVVVLAGHVARVVRKHNVSVDMLPPKSMICLETHSCRVLTEPPRGVHTGVDRQFPYPVYIEALLWAKGERMSWEPRRFCLAFSSEDEQHEWYVLIKKAIKSHHQGGAGKSVMATLYTGNQASPRNISAHPRFSDVRDLATNSRDLKIDSDSVASTDSSPRISQGSQKSGPRTPPTRSPRSSGAPRQSSKARMQQRSRSDLVRRV